VGQSNFGEWDPAVCQGGEGGGATKGPERPSGLGDRGDEGGAETVVGGWKGLRGLAAMAVSDPFGSWSYLLISFGVDRWVPCGQRCSCVLCSPVHRCLTSTATLRCVCAYL